MSTATPHERSNDDPFETVEEAAAFYAEAYRKFIYLRGVIDPFPNQLLDPSIFQLPRPAGSFYKDIVFSTAEDFARLLANRTNSFLALLFGLKSWQQILPKYSAMPRHYLEVEFVWPLLQLGIGEPSAIRNQIVFSITKLAILADSFALQHEIPRDEDINFGMLDRWAAHWPGYTELRKGICELNSRSFVTGTKNFRNRRAHSIAPSPFGIIPAHVVRKEGRDWRMIWRHEPRLEIEKVVDLLVQQHLAAAVLVEELRSFLRARFEK